MRKNSTAGIFTHLFTYYFRVRAMRGATGYENLRFSDFPFSKIYLLAVCLWHEKTSLGSVLPFV